MNCTNFNLLQLSNKCVLNSHLQLDLVGNKKQIELFGDEVKTEEN